MGSNFQTDIHGFGGSESYRTAAISKRDGSNLYRINKHNNSKMAETIAAKILNIFGLSVYILGVFANFFASMNTGLSLCLGLVGLAWMFFRALKMREDWIIRKMEKENMREHLRRQHHKHIS